jgi:quercetin dioxygenase-like cupin family protein
MTKANEREQVRVEHAQGGAGYMVKEELLSADERGAHCSMFNQVTLPEGCEIGWHQHVGNGEAYYVAAGQGIYNDNGTEIAVSVGDCTFCKDGDWHALKNTGSGDLVIVAVILESDKA